MLIPQCETLGCLEHIEGRVEGAGNRRYSWGPSTFPRPWAYPASSDARVQDALRHVQRACADAGKPSFIFAATPEAAREDFEMGYGSVTYGMDASTSPTPTAAL